MKQIKCNSCGGSGIIKNFKHIANGVCFTCGGKGFTTSTDTITEPSFVQKKAPAIVWKWAATQVRSIHHADGNGGVIIRDGDKPIQYRVAVDTDYIYFSKGDSVNWYITIPITDKAMAQKYFAIVK